MTIGWLNTLGLTALVILGILCGSRLRNEYRTRNELTYATVAAVWALYTLHFGLTVAAAIEPTWSLPLPRTLAATVGLLLVIAGLIICATAMVAFRSLRRLSGMDSSRLITTGIYSWSRNPQNVGWTLVLVGIALLSASGLALLLAALFWISFRFYLPLEEQLLDRIFGDSYRAYCARTHRYFGPPKET